MGKHTAAHNVYPQCNGFNNVIKLQRMSLDEALMIPAAAGKNTISIKKK